MSWGITVWDNSGEVVSSPEGANPRIVGYAFSMVAGYALPNDPQTTNPPPLSNFQWFKAIPGMVPDGTWAVISESSEAAVRSIVNGGFNYGWSGPGAYSSNGYIPNSVMFIILRVG